MVGLAVADVTDVQKRYDRPLTPAESEWAETLLGDAEAKIRTRIPDVAARADADPHFRKVVVMVEANAVLRVIRNPDGYRQEAEGNYSYLLSAAVAAGHLFIMDSEWADLGVSTGAFTITPVGRTARGPGWPRRRWRR